MIDINASFLFQLGLFWLSIIFLNTMLFKPMLKYLDYRKSLVEGRKAEADKLQKEKDEKENYYLGRIKEAKEKGMEYKKAYREDILKDQKQIFEGEQRKIEEGFSKKKNLLLGEAENAKKDISRISQDLGKHMAEKVLGRSV